MVLKRLGHVVLKVRILERTEAFRRAPVQIPRLPVRAREEPGRPSSSRPASGGSTRRGRLAATRGVSGTETVAE